MAMIMTSSGAVFAKAGANANSTIQTGANLGKVEQWVSGAESTINVLTRINYSDTYATLNVDVKHLLEDVASSLAAINVITYDMSGYTSRYEAETMMDVLRDSAMRGISLLRDKKATTFIDGA